MRGSKPTKMKNTELEPCILESLARSKKHACLFGSPKFLLEMELSNIKSRVAGLLLSSMEKWVSLIQVFDRRVMSICDEDLGLNNMFLFFN